MMCELLAVSRSGLHAAAQRESSERRLEEVEVVEQIRRAQIKHKGRYGRRRMTPEVSEALGRKINHKRIGRLMREHDLRSRKRRPFRVRTTDSKHPYPIAPNILERDFAATAPDQKWLTDMTYVPTAEGWLYLALVLDLFARKIVGWAMSERIDTALVLAAWNMALCHRQPPEGLLFHSDRGVQYASSDYRQALQAAQAIPSMSRKANCYDNATMESFWSTLKLELIYRRHWTSPAEVKAHIFDFIERFYNRKRLHSALGYASPADFENRNN